MLKFALQKLGGSWLGAARKWIQWNCINGSNVIWGSNTELHPPITVSKVEDLASEVAASVIDDILSLLKKLYGYRNSEYVPNSMFEQLKYKMKEYGVNLDVV